MTSIQLNLARKWRSKNFDQIVGQDLSVRMLKNSLYLGHYFPVYLFSGKKGCGKTTTARVFAAAVNCAQLDAFRKNPKDAVIPCLTCASCSAMQVGKHPDFIEMDAASNTGVDNVRNIIDAATLMPILGRKKIYLIDEAHMLSKAAFNAFLKILEEPPTSVLFILATTDPQKIIDTVKSRCFQLFFSAIEHDRLRDHLKHVCTQERIAYDEHGLDLIIQETEGSARDALNLLEQVRFSSNTVSPKNVQRVLGHIDDTRLVTLFNRLITQQPAALFASMQELDLASFSPEYIWAKMVELVRIALWLKHGVEPAHFVHYAAELKRSIAHVSWQELHTMLTILYNHEYMFVRTTAKAALLEMILLQLAQVHTGSDDPESSGSPASAASPDEDEDDVQDVDDESDDDTYDDDEEDEEEEEDEQGESYEQRWDLFVQDVDTLHMPLVSSVLKQSRFVQFDTATGDLSVEFAKDMAFFKEALEHAQPQWMPLLKKKFARELIFQPTFTGQIVERKQIKVLDASQQTAQPAQDSAVAKRGPIKPAPTAHPMVKSAYPAGRTESGFAGHHEKKLDISDTQQWSKTHMLLRYFPGTVTEIQETIHEQTS